jgi:hypothetical protein
MKAKRVRVSFMHVLEASATIMRRSTLPMNSVSLVSYHLQGHSSVPCMYEA